MGELGILAALTEQTNKKRTHTKKERERCANRLLSPSHSPSHILPYLVFPDRRNASRASPPAPVQIQNVSRGETRRGIKRYSATQWQSNLSSGQMGVSSRLPQVGPRMECKDFTHSRLTPLTRRDFLFV